MKDKAEGENSGTGDDGVVVDAAENDEYARFESLARKVVGTPKPKPSAEAVGPGAASAGEPAANGAEREEADGHR